MRRHFITRLSAPLVLAPAALAASLTGAAALLAGGCTSGPAAPGGAAGSGGGSGGGGSGGTSTGTEEGCAIAQAPLEIGDPDGHADPYGAKKAGQARAGRIKSPEQIVQPAHGRQKIEVGDLVLANDKIAVTVEDKGLSDGYARFGGEILAIDRVGDDGRPAGVSYYGETLFGLSVEMLNPTSVTVLSDGSDGKEAVVRVLGVTQPIPFLEGPIGALFPDRYGVEAALDYVLKPGWEKVLLRLSVVNRNLPSTDPEIGDGRLKVKELLGMFHYSRSQPVTQESGFAKPSGDVEWAGFDSGPSSFAFRAPDGKMEYSLTQSGFSLFWAPGFTAEPCTVSTHDHVEIILGGPGFDGLGEAVRRVTAADPWRSIKGTLKDAAGKPVAGAFIHELGPSGAYLSRTATAADGAFEIHAPAGQAVKLIPQKRGYPAHAGAEVGAAVAQADMAFAPNAALHITAADVTTAEPLPVRVQVIPKDPAAPTPAAFGVLDEEDGRLYQDFAVTGESTLIVPPGEHHVIVSRGYEWEIYETDVLAEAGKTSEITAPLLHSVDTAGRLCADFHIHSFHSADSNDAVEHKVKGALADGLDIPVSTEHEWIVDFQPVIEGLGLTKWARGVPGEELTTFAWGHFGVMPLEPKPGDLNNGAVDWIGSKPGEIFGRVHSRAEAPALIVNHPRGAGIGAYFSASNYDRDKGVGLIQDLWSEDFEAIEVFNNSDFEKNRDASVADWFSLLNHGKKAWAVGSSDSHHLRTSPVGYPRTCLFFGHDDLTKVTGAAVRDAVKSGDATISGGLYMTVTGPGGEHPGEEAQVDANGEAVFTVTVEAPSWLGADTLETIVSGQTISTEPLLPMGAGPSKKFVNQVKVKLDAASGWVVFHARGEGSLAPLHPGKRPFAASNPIFLKK